MNRARFKCHNDYVDEPPDDVIEVNHYGRHDDISDLYYHDDVFYVSDRDRYRVINKHQNNHGRDYIKITLPSGLKLEISYNKFRREYDLD